MRVALVQMPVAQLELPNLGLSLLKATLRQYNVGADVFYLSHWFAEHLNPEYHAALASGEPMVHDLSAEWLFTEALWGKDPHRDSEYLETVALGKSVHHRKEPKRAARHAERLAEAREAVDPFLSRCMSQVDWSKYDVVGFSSSFQQQISSLALARRLKANYPEMTVVFGGANCEDIMGEALLKEFSFIDAVCTGEGDWAFPEFIRSLVDRAPGCAPQGIITRSSPHPGSSGVPNRGRSYKQKKVDLNALPFPDFDDYFAHGIRKADKNNWAPSLVVESSRGCWWGEKSHCTFCGLNANSMAFRSKEPGRMLSELRWLLKRYGHHTRSIVATDNIMPHTYGRELLPALHDVDIDLFYESKANLRKAHLKAYREAGIHRFQPGIESLSTPVLKIMRKGTTGIQNVQTLVWSRHYGIIPSWNYLTGFPGERSEFYRDQISLIETLQHLTPPSYCGPIRFDRFSPYVSRPFAYGISNLTPYPAYRYIYPGLSESARSDLAYFFVGEFAEQDCAKDYAAELNAAIGRWQNANCFLVALAVGDELLVIDTRDIASNRVTRLHGLRRWVLEACAEITSIAKLRRAPAARTVSQESLLAEIDWLLQKRFLIAEDDRLLSVVVPAEGGDTRLPHATDNK